MKIDEKIIACVNLAIAEPHNYLMQTHPLKNSCVPIIISKSCKILILIAQPTIKSFNINWQDLLSSDLGVSEFGFRSLLYNRHEMQDGAYLEEQEKKPVETLKSVYENEPRELG